MNRTKTIILLSVLLGLWTYPVFAQAPTLTQTTPVTVNGGQTFTFTCATNCGGGTWSVAGTDASGNVSAAAGSIIAGTGVYTAPATVTVQQPYEGCQLLPNNDIVNTIISGLSVNTNNAAWMAQADSNTVYLVVGPNHNVIDNTVGTVSVTSQNNPSGSGTYQILGPPIGIIQSGWYHVSGPDQHYLTIRKDTCAAQELIDPVGPGGNTDFSTSVGATNYSGTGYTLPVPSGANQSGSDVSGQRMQAIQLHYQEYLNALNNSIPIKHALRLTMPNAEIHNGTGGIGTAFLWPAANPSFSGSGAIPQGARVRLKSTFDCTTLMAGFRPVCTALKAYGAFLDDGGFQRWNFVFDDDYWCQTIFGCDGFIWNPPWTPASFEFVDESSLQMATCPAAPSASCNNWGECKCNREIVTFTTAGGSATVDVILTGVTIGVEAPLLNFAVGAAPHQIAAWVNGTSNSTITWSMSPAVGTLSSTGVYTPPAWVSSTSGEPTTTTIMATSAASASAIATIQVNIYAPQGNTLYLFSLNSVTAGNIGAAWPVVLNNITWQDFANNWLDSSGQLVTGVITHPPWADNNTMLLYRSRTQPYADQRFDIFVPNGAYTVTSKWAESYWTTGGGEHTDPELNGTRLMTNFNVFNAAGGQYIPYDFSNSATVSANKLSYVLRSVDGFNNGISATQIIANGGQFNQPAQIGHLP